MLGDQALRDHRFELVIKNVDAVDFAVRVTLDDALAVLRGEGMLDFAENADVLADDLNAACSCDGACRPQRWIVSALILQRSSLLELGKRRRMKSRPLRPMHSTSIFCSGFESMNLLTTFRIFVLKAPARPLSPVTTISRTFSSGARLAAGGAALR